ncbi:MAG: ribosome-associated translation inhibitor RaiA [Thermoanaerobaculia bacterium]|nr:ribosome-associated translation inhibitor RaiA [Thermoanaerobaculia bacterium]
MNVDYVGRNYPLDDRIREHTEEKLAKLLKFLQEPVEIRVTLEQEKHRQIAELHLAHRHGVIQATDEAETMPDAVNLAAAKAEKQARRATKKFQDKRRRADRNNHVHHWPIDVLEGESVATGQPRIVRSSRIPVKPMSIEEAALELDGSKHEFVVFRNSATSRVNVLYRRRDSNYGLIAPE